MGVSFGGQLALNPVALRERLLAQNLPADWFGRPNSYECPRGIRPGTGWLLLTRGALTALNFGLLYDLTFTSQETPDSVAASVTLKNLCLVDAVCVTPGLHGDASAAYLVQLADRRQLYQHILIDKAYNVVRLMAPPSSVPSYYSATLNGSSAWTWQQMFADVWNTVGKLGTAPMLPVTPDGTPENFSFYGGYALEALEQILDYLGCELTLNPLTDTFGVVQVGQADPAFAAVVASTFERRVWDDDPLTSTRAAVPAAVKVLFRKDLRYPDQTGASPYYSLTETDPQGPLAETEPNTAVLIYDTLLALYDASGALLNGSDLTSRAAQRAADYFRQVRQASFRSVWGRPLDNSGLAPGAQLTTIRWGDRGRGMVTEAVCRPRPILTRPPRVPSPDTAQIAIVNDQTPDPTTGLYSATIQLYDPATETWTRVENIWLRDANQ